jgi:putative FmdB family regulatory protein
MPLYDYRCTACGHEVEVMHSVHGTGPEACERCGAPMRKALSTPAIHFKGSGWAKKDARSASGGAGSGKGSSTADAGGKVAEGGGTSGPGSETGGAAVSKDGPATGSDAPGSRST